MDGVDAWLQFAASDAEQGAHAWLEIEGLAASGHGAVAPAAVPAIAALTSSLCRAGLRKFCGSTTLHRFNFSSKRRFPNDTF